MGIFDFFGKGGLNTVFESPGFELKKVDFIEASSTSLYTSIFAEILRRCTFKDDESVNMALFYNSMNTSYRQKYGLIHYIVLAYRTSARFWLLVSDDKKTITKLDQRPSDEGIAEKNIVELDFRHYKEPMLVAMLYGMLYELNQSSLADIRAANTIIVKIDKMRESLTSVNVDQVKKQIADFAEAFKDSGSLAFMDAGDSLEKNQVSSESTRAGIDIILSQIAMVTQMPQSFIGKNARASLGDTGAADEAQLSFALNRPFQEIFKPVVEQIFETTCSLEYFDMNDLEQKLRIVGMISVSDGLSAEKRAELVDRVLR